MDDDGVDIEADRIDVGQSPTGFRGRKKVAVDLSVLRQDCRDASATA